MTLAKSKLSNVHVKFCLPVFLRDVTFPFCSSQLIYLNGHTSLTIFSLFWLLNKKDRIQFSIYSKTVHTLNVMWKGNLIQAHG